MADLKLETRHFINNEYTLPSTPDPEKYTLRNPANDSHVAEISFAGPLEVDAVVSAARKAFEGEWASFSGAQRAKCMLKFADLLEQNAEEIAKLDPLCMGMPVAISKMVQVPFCANSFRFYAGLADKIAGETYPPDTTDGFYKLVTYEPLGVCAGIAAWNVPLVFLGWKVAPALAAGNTFIFKASEKAPLAILACGRLFKEAGFPLGVINFLNGGAATGELLAKHMDIDKISFTGSIATGRKVQNAATKSNLKKVTLGLGGKSPAIVFDDARLESAVKHCSEGFLLNCGQICFAASRIYVQESVAESFIQGLKAVFEAVGGALGTDPMEPATILGPLADQQQLKRVTAYLDEAKNQSGGEVLVGGEKKGDQGCFVKPTVILSPDMKSKIYTEEVFGPVLTVTKFKSEEEVLQLANDSIYGLSACIFTSDIARALRVASKLKAGSVAINSSFLPDDKTPFGGYKQSGIGLECGKAALDSYLQAKTIKINMSS